MDLIFISLKITKKQQSLTHSRFGDTLWPFNCYLHNTNTVIYVEKLAWYRNFVMLRYITGFPTSIYTDTNDEKLLPLKKTTYDHKIEWQHKHEHALLFKLFFSILMLRKPYNVICSCCHCVTLHKYICYDHCKIRKYLLDTNILFELNWTTVSLLSPYCDN